MSEDELHIGRLKRVNLDGLTLEAWCQEKCKSKGINELRSYDNSWEDAFRDEFDEKFFIVKGEVYELIDHRETDDHYGVKLEELPDGTISFMAAFYNGGTCLSELIEEGLTKMENGKYEEGW